VPPVEAVASAPPAPIQRARLTLLLGLIAALIVASNVGTILSATLVNDHPVALLALSARNRHLLLTVAAGIGAVPYALVSFARLVVPAVAFFVLGQGYGDRGLRWIEQQAGGTPASLRWIEKGFDRASLPIVFFMPGSNLVCLLAGARRITARTFAAVLAAGIVARLAFFWFLGKAFQEPLETVLEWINRYQWWLVGGFFILTVAQSFRRAAVAVREMPPTDETAPVEEETPG
jgi:membrane protein DedA with SNARE-associated domain